MKRLSLLDFKKKRRRALVSLIILTILGLVVDVIINDLPEKPFRERTGRPFGYGETFENNEARLDQQWGIDRVAHNFKNFFQYWQKPALGKAYSNLREFLQLDNNAIWVNVSHFIGFMLLAFILWILGMNILWIFIYLSFFNVVHEYIIEGIFVDPSFNDLWVDQIAICSMVLVILIIQKVFFSSKNLTKS